LCLVSDAELEERLPLHDLDGALAVINAGQLDDDPVVAGLLDDRLGHAEFVDTRANDLERAFDRVFLVGHGTL
jgi:hypothetical protein